MVLNKMYINLNHEAFIRKETKAVVQTMRHKKPALSEINRAYNRRNNN